MIIKGKWNNNCYRLINLIGAGNFGKVYKGIDSKGTIVAIKTSKDMLSITNEYNAMAKLEHMPFIPKIYDLDDWYYDGEIRHFIIMDYIQGEDLKKLINKKDLNPKTIFKLGLILINILVKINELGYKYTDIKLENIIIDKKGNVYFVDFGGLIEKDKPTKEYTPTYNINSWNVEFKYDDEIGILFSITMVMVSLIGKREYNPLISNLEQVVTGINALTLGKVEKQFLIKGLKGKFKTFSDYKKALSLLIEDQKSNKRLDKIDYLLIISIVSFVFVIIAGIKSIL